MKIILTAIIIAGVIFYGVLNTPQQTTDAPTPEESAESQPPDDAERKTGEQEILADASPTPRPTSADVTLTPTPQVDSSPTPTPTATSSSETQRTVNEHNMHCDQPGCITWTHQITVPHTMHRWGIWSQFVGSGMMSWERFVYEVESVNPILKLDGHMFKVNNTYLLPECIDMGSH